MQALPLSAVLILAVALSGCATTAPAEPPPAPAPEPQAICDASGAQFAVGQSATPQLEAAVRHRAGAAISRVLGPNQAATMELNPSRINLDVDAQGRVTGARCG